LVILASSLRWIFSPFFLDDAVRKLLVDYGFREGTAAARDALAAFIGLP
jgi:hypothetical protein